MLENPDRRTTRQKPRALKPQACGLLLEHFWNLFLKCLGGRMILAPVGRLCRWDISVLQLIGW